MFRSLWFLLLLGVNGFTLDYKSGEFVLTHKDIRIPKWGKVRASATCSYIFNVVITYSDDGVVMMILLFAIANISNKIDPYCK